MAVELLAGRLTAPFFGQSVKTWSALTAVVLAGCTAGNAVSGFLSERRKAAVWRLVAATGLYVAALPFLLRLYAPLGLTGFAAAGWLPVSFGLGLVTPYAAACAVRVERPGRDLGALYFGSMAGSVLGSAAAGLWLPFTWPADVLYMALGAVLLALGVLLRRMDCREFSVAAGAGRIFDALPPFRSLAIMFAVGAAGMAYEMACGRMVTSLLGGNHVVWGVLFMSFIGWMGLGGWFGGKAGDRFGGRWMADVALVATAAALSGTAVVESRMFGGRLLPDSVAMQLLVVEVVGFGPAGFMLGFAGTVLLRRFAAGPLGEGRRGAVGYLYAASGAGGAAGTFLAGLWLVGRVESPVLACWCAGMCAAIALPRTAGWFGVAGVVLAATFVRPPVAGAIAESDEAVVSREESAYGTVTVTQDLRDQRLRTVWLDRIPHTTINMRDAGALQSSYTRMIDAVVRGGDVFMIGGGGYALPRLWGRAADGRKFTRVVVAEIDPAVTRAAVTFLDGAADGPCEYVAEDGRRAAGRLPKGAFDYVIGDTISDASIPYHLVTREFDEELKGLLKPGGVFILHALDTLDEPALLATLLKTVRGVFAHVEALAYAQTRDTRQSFVIVASDDAAAADVSGAAAAIARRYEDRYVLRLDDATTEEISGREGAMVLTDRFSPVERFAWRVIADGLSRKGMRLGARAKAALDVGDSALARRLAFEALGHDPEEIRALEVLAEAAMSGDAEAMRAIEKAAGRPTPNPSPRALLKYVQEKGKLQ